MSKDYLRDYCTEAFRFYKRIADTCGAALSESEQLDIQAVRRTLERMDDSGRTAIDIVYFADPDKSLEKGDISSRVLIAEINIPASEKTVYRWLKQARHLFAVERGLRLY